MRANYNIPCACECGTIFPALDGRGRSRRYIHGHKNHSQRVVRVPRIRPTAEERFWAKVNKGGPVPAHRPELGACWLWTGSGSRQGYGWIDVESRGVQTHRFSWELHNGPIPDGLWVLHHCDNPPCVRPDHLFLGTHGDNVADKMAKGRGNHASGERHGSRTHPEQIRKGERHSHVKLTLVQVSMIRERYAAGGVSYRQLAEEYGIALSTAGAVVRGDNWGWT